MSSTSSAIYIAGFPATWEANHILTLCCPYGPVMAADIATNKLGKPYAIVRYAQPKEVKETEHIECGNPAEEAVHELNGGRFFGRRISVRIFVPKVHVYRYRKEEEDTFSDTASVMTTDTYSSKKPTPAAAVATPAPADAGFWGAFCAETIGEAKAPKLVVVIPEPKKKEEEKKEEAIPEGRKKKVVAEKPKVIKREAHMSQRYIKRHNI